MWVASYVYQTAHSYQEFGSSYNFDNYNSKTVAAGQEIW